MSFAVLAVSVLLAHSPQQVPAAPDCLAAADEAMSAYCAGKTSSARAVRRDRPRSARRS